jgi:hypothetical protein
VGRARVMSRRARILWNQNYNMSTMVPMSPVVHYSSTARFTIRFGRRSAG